MNQQIKVLTDREIMDDILNSQKHITDTYNLWSNECINAVLRDGLLKILREEHILQSTVYMDMQKRGWQTISMADQQEIDKVRSKYEQISQSL